MNPAHLKVAIIGGGIGGLAAALALRKIGAAATVFERAPAIREIGAGLGLWANAVRVLDGLGVGGAIRAVAQPMATIGIHAADGRPLSVTDMTALTRELGTPSFVMHRADLQQALVAALPAETLVVGAECAGIEEQGDGVIVRFTNHESAKADLVVGADGFHSTIRRHLWGESDERYSGQTCYRGVVRMQVKQPGLLAEVQGRGRRLGHCPFARDRMYWFACHNAPPNQPEDPRGAKAKLLEMFRGWPFDMAGAIAATPDDAIIRNDLCDRWPLKAWSRGRVTLLGDAAHPMLPNLGQGACTAIEDALVLARSVKEAASLEEALAIYESARLPRTTRMVSLSWRFGQVARWSTPMAVALREAMFRLTPKAMMRRELLWQLGWGNESDHC